MPDRWGPDGPPLEAYSRVTDPQRFAPAVAEADRVVAALVERYDVVPVPAEHPEAERAVRLLPARGAPLLVGVTSFPGVVLQAGTWADPQLLPSCGCDACDESADDVVERLHDLVGAVVTGRLSEHLSRRPRRLAVTWRYDHGHESSTEPLSRERFAELAARAPAGLRTWPAWPLPGAGTATTT